MTGPSSGGSARGRAGQPGPMVDVLIESAQWQGLPTAEAVIRCAIASAAKARPVQIGGAEVSVLLCDDAAIAALNARWRGREGPTNVLSFPPPHGEPSPRGADRPTPLGDIAIAYETAAREAADHGKTLPDHLAHLAVHGFLHLLGYDHHLESEAERMERLERDILAEIGVPDPYDGWTDDRRDGG
jgi:probable rRNA maturation factor